MMLKKIVFVAFFICGLSSNSYSFKFRPQVSLLTNYTATKNYTTVKSGAFDIENRKVNFGLELTHKFYLLDHVFLKTGFRYNTYKTSFYGENQIPEFYDKPSQLTWKRGFETFVVPIQLGMDLVLGNGHKGDFYVGFGAGIFHPTSYEASVSTGVPKTTGYNNIVHISSWDSTTSVPSSFFPTIDVGANYVFKNKPRLSIGVLCSVQLNKTEPYSFYGMVQDVTAGKTYSYEIQQHQSFVNYAVTLNYTFGKLRPTAGKQDKLNCP